MGFLYPANSKSSYPLPTEKVVGDKVHSCYLVGLTLAYKRYWWFAEERFAHEVRPHDHAPQARQLRACAQASLTFYSLSQRLWPFFF